MLQLCFFLTVQIQVMNGLVFENSPKKKRDDFMKNAKLLYSLVLCYSGLLMGAAETHEATFEGILKQQPIRETLSIYLSKLPKRELGGLSRVSRFVHGAVEPAVVTAMEEAAKWESHILNAGYLDLSEQRENRDNQAFKDNVIKRIEDFATYYPGKWIKLNLADNNLGNDSAFLRDLLQAIITTVYALKIDLASLNLSGNQLSSLPEHLFKGLNNLQKLDLIE